MKPNANGRTYINNYDTGSEDKQITWNSSWFYKIISYITLKINEEIIMGLFGKILSAPIRILNFPARVVEKMVDPDSKLDDKDNVFSKPLETLAQAIEEVDKDED